MAAALQWTPGYNAWSNVNRTEGANADDIADLFIGAKIQLIGNTALLAPSEDICIAIAPGIKVHLTDGPDFGKEFLKYARNMPAGTPGIPIAAGERNEFTASKADKHAFAAGGRLYFDYIFTKEFFINFYNETIIYLQTKKLKNHDLPSGHYLMGTGEDCDVGYKYQLTFEIEPNYTMQFTYSYWALCLLSYFLSFLSFLIFYLNSYLLSQKVALCLF